MGLTAIFIFLHVKFFYSIYTAEELIIPYGLKPFDICSENPVLWKYLKIIHIVSYIISIIILCHFFISKFLKKFSQSKKVQKEFIKTNCHSSSKKSHHLTMPNSLQLCIGFNNISKTNVYIPESGLYQNFLITGTIGPGKTSSVMYRLMEQVIQFNF